jgi:hypothetical protein
MRANYIQNMVNIQQFERERNRSALPGGISNLELMKTSTFEFKAAH